MPRHPNKREGFFQKLFGRVEAPNPRAIAAHDAYVVPDPTRCVQCGVCGYNCPVGIPVRDYARQGKIVDDARCVQCGQCIEVCPRGTLRWGKRGVRPSVGGQPGPEDEMEYADVMRPFLESSSGDRETQA
jgi:ferredoxin